MKRTFFLFSLLAISLTSFSQTGKKELKFNETYRPQYHFSPESNRMGSPVSIIQIDSVYHLFYQLNPHNLQQGFVNWGHAYSKDLIKWVHDGISISQPENISDSMKFTPWWGSVVVKDNEIYAWYNSWEEGIFKQKSSKDLVWKEKELISGMDNINKCEPFVFRNEKYNKWVMFNFNRSDSTLNFFDSNEGTRWEKKSSFNYKYGFPCFIELPIDGKPDNTRWLLLSEKGTFVMCNFNNEKIELTSALSKFDEGKKIGGSLCFYDKLKNRYILFSELKSEQHPDLPSNGQLSFPAEIKLHETPSGIELIKTPIEEIKNLYKRNYEWSAVKIYPGINNNILAKIKETSFHLKGIIDLKNCDQFGFIIRSDKDRNGTEINYHVSRQQLSAFNSKINFKPDNNKIEIEILVDRSSIEIFLDGGRYSVSSTFIPDADKQKCELYTIGGEIMVDHLEVHSLKSVWREE